MRYISEIESHDNVRTLVMQDLKELGIKVPKAKKIKSKEESALNNCGVFGNYLTLVPCMLVDECGPVPTFLVQATHILDKHIDIEGLFRKSGSVARQKELKTKIEASEDLLEANPLDVAGLIKQFFRELPDPLFTARLHDTFLKCHSLDSEDARVTAILLLCHLLPWHHLSTLRYMMLFLQKVAHNCDLNKMDIANLAVCVTPNLMHNNNSAKSDKMTDSKWLQIQTSIVQMLVLYAGDIGMVPDSLYERSVLMSSCFPTDDELERSEAVQEESTTKTNNKKKKKRSGSLQGLVNNLSTSFSKWRKDNRGHNASSISDRSTMSYLSFDKSSMVSDSADLTRMTLPPGVGDEFLDPGLYIEATPKMIRKRKAEDEAVPFSASKKKAILQHMPQMATLGSTPFTPVARRGRYPGDFQETPNIKFVDADNMVFNGGSTPSLVTPKRKMDKMFSPYSSTKVKRQSSGKSGCFSPKTTSKSNMRKSVRGFFRRLSGGKEPHPSSPSSVSQLEVGQRLAGVPDSLHIMDPTAGQKKKTFFKRHRKTPSSPARLVTNMAAELQREKIAMASRGSSASNVKTSEQDMDASFSNSELASRLGSDLSLVSPIGDPDQTPVNGGKVRRSNMSLDSTATSLRRGRPNTVMMGLPMEYHKRRSLDIDTYSGNDEDIDSVANTLDTSPILKENRSSPREIDVDTAATPIAGDTHLIRQSSTSSVLSRQLSKTSMISKLEESLSNPLDSGLDQAFINESLLGDVTHLGDSSDKCRLSDTNVISPDPESESRYTVKYSCVEVTVDLSDVSARGDTNVKRGPVDLVSQHSIDSYDSAVGSEAGQDLYKSSSLHSLHSCDSGLGIHTNNENKISVKSDSSLVSSKLAQRSVTPHEGTSHNLSCDLAMNTNKVEGVSENSIDGQDSKLLRESVRDLHNAAKVSTGVQQFDSDVQEIEKRRDSPHRFCNSPMRRVPNSPVRIPTIFAKADKEASHYREIAKSALFSSSRTASIRRPKLPISTNLVRCDSVQRCKKNLRMPDDDVFIPDSQSSGSAGHTPAKTTQSHPMRVIEFDTPNPNSQSMIDGDTKQPLREHNPVNMTLPDNIPSTPRIKPMLLTSDKSNLMLSKSMTTDMKRHRTPIKPVKRLTNSPRRMSRSPRRMSTSPRKPGAGKRGMSPLPNQDPDWNI